MSMSTIELARYLEMLDESPEKMMFGKLLTELSGMSEERVKSAARQVPISGLRELVHQFNKVIEERRGERVRELAQALANDGISVDELREYLTQRCV
ncbi:hypothetical protein AL542_09995 [Grimontia hollisae]|uniref:DNA-binding protein H-NS-like N-terminal domain-containing protein n=2 Tax=Grimontia hollisae TaxID=673 RepID=D0I379_GRIHO|nr:hypothetical protein [Grimontia hollisae]AMG30663.1 hypothetical protein AL542_09995 [Grimontia hollisae]EEY74121.1 hypothetical protein VHA_000210 [Grimontia hollisae CIP 101886]MDF2186718.1 hypothetical protein [Grimontia hollisae]STO47700.1 Uncharacterised protein [Grimontia hollisae]STO58514.1 Uncharacterised protein [Grimontia hollisae]